MSGLKSYLHKHQKQIKPYLDKVLEQGLPVIVYGPCKSNPYLPGNFAGGRELSGQLKSVGKGHQFEWYDIKDWLGADVFTHTGAGSEEILWEPLVALLLGL